MGCLGCAESSKGTRIEIHKVSEGMHKIRWMKMGRAFSVKPSAFSLEGPLLPLLKTFTVLAGGVIGVKQTVFNTQELELPRSFGRWILNYLVIHWICGGFHRDIRFTTDIGSG